MPIFQHKKYLEKDDQLELRKRQDQITQQLLIVDALTLVKNTWLKQQYPKYRLRKDKNYRIDARTGFIEEIK